MTNFKYKLFATFFNFYQRIFKLNKDNVSLIIINKDKFSGNLRYIYNELNKKDNDLQYTIISRNEYDLSEIKGICSFLRKIVELFHLFIIKSYKLAISRYIFLNDNFLPMAYMNLDPEVSVVQVWHGPGVFKKFGLSSVTDPNLRKLEKQISDKLDYVIVSSHNVVSFYKDAFGVSEEKIIPLGTPRVDFYFKENDIEKLRKNFERLYPESKNKKIILYAPTFRDNPTCDKNILENLDMGLFNKELGDQYVLAVRLHPRINNVKVSKDVINVTPYKDEKELLLMADILITDYSSIIVEYSLLNKPMIFYPYDYDYYTNFERGFYFDYKQFVPGPVAYNTAELIQIIKSNCYDLTKIKEFTKFQFDYFDGKSTQRIIKYIMTNKV